MWFVQTEELKREIQQAAAAAEAAKAAGAAAAQAVKDAAKEIDSLRGVSPNLYFEILNQ